MDNVSERRLADVHPALAAKIRLLSNLLQPEGIPFRVVQGLRSWSEQAALYAQVPKVTNAPPGHSWHNFGLAVDVAPDDPRLPGYQPDWNANHPAWKRLIEVAESVGLTSGTAWNDRPHLQLTGRFPTSPDDEVRQLFEHGGLASVWDESGVG